MRYWLPVFLWMTLIFLMSTGRFSAEQTSRVVGPLLAFFFPGITPEQLETAHWVVRKGGHVAEYFVLGLLLFRAFRAGSIDRRRLRWAVWAVIVSIAYAASDEFHQSFVATRTPSVIDVGIDTAGAMLAQLFRRMTVKT